MEMLSIVDERRFSALRPVYASCAASLRPLRRDLRSPVTWPASFWLSKRLLSQARTEIHSQSTLTPREIEVLKFVAEGLTNRQIAAEMK